MTVKPIINRIRKSLFARWTLLFAAITVVSIVSLAFTAYSYLNKTIMERELDVQKNAMDAVNDYISRKFESVQGMAENMYRNQSLSVQTALLLKNSYEDFIRHNLDRYDAVSGVANNIITHYKDKLDDDPDIDSLILYSSEKHYLYMFKQNRTMELRIPQMARSYIPEAMALDVPPVDLPNSWLIKELGAGVFQNGLLSMRVTINDKNTYQNIGRMIVLYKSDALQQIVERTGGNNKGTIVVLSANGFALFDSSGEYTGKRHPEAEVLQSLDAEEKFKEDILFSKLINNNAGYTIVGMTSKTKASEAYRGLFITMIILTAASVLLVVFIPGMLVLNYAKRTGNIIRFMHKVKEGQLRMRIPDQRDDELGQISKSFNDMLDQLNLYIDRVYKAEIKQKSSEYAALQARVNPHFLYNTLEVIRMRAISQGVDDVAEMIYSLSALFRNVVQDKSIYLLKDEIQMCRLYLELFRIRYRDTFSYQIKMQPQAGNAETLKLILQPVIENYIVHGLRKDDKDNFIEINVYKENEAVHIQVKDNGMGMPDHKREQLMASLEQTKKEREDQSFGMRSVYERLRLVYGSAGGLEVWSKESEGTSVLIYFPITKEGTNIYVQSNDR